MEKKIRGNFQSLASRARLESRSFFHRFSIQYRPCRIIQARVGLAIAYTLFLVTRSFHVNRVSFDALDALPTAFTFDKNPIVARFR